MDRFTVPRPITAFLSRRRYLVIFDSGRGRTIGGILGTVTHFRMVCLLSFALLLGGCGAGNSTPPTTAFSPSSPQLAEPEAGLRTYVTTTLAKEETAAADVGPSLAVWPADVAEYSPPLRLSNQYVAVAAYGFDPSGHPVQVVRLNRGKWSVLAALPPPNEPGTVSHPDSLLLMANGVSRDIQVVSPSRGTLEFYIPFTGGGCTRGPVLSNIGGTWHYIPFIGHFPTTEVMGGNPRFQGTTLVSDNDCAANISQAQQASYTWAYDEKTGALVGTEHPGWPPNP